MGYDFKSLTKQADEASNRNKFYTDFEDVNPSTLHQISELTEWLRTKAKGSDVREIIAQLFERTWLEGTKEGSANMEVAKARASFVDLSARLSNFEGIVNAKADDAEIRILLANILDGSPKGTFANMAALRQAHPGGAQGVFITTDNRNWNYWNGSSWVAGGVYQANNSEFSAQQLTEGKTIAYLRTTEMSIDFDAMRIVVKGAAIMDGVNNIWPPDYAGALTAGNGFLVFNKSTRRFDMSPIERFDKNNVILGFFWANGVGNINSISRYDVKKNGRWKAYNVHDIQTATLIGGQDITIKNFRFSETPKVQLDGKGKIVEWNVSSPDITRVNNATSGYILFDSVNKTFLLKAIETNLTKEPETTYYVATLWATG